jgi:hypothetical protein
MDFIVAYYMMQTNKKITPKPIHNTTCNLKFNNHYKKNLVKVKNILFEFIPNFDCCLKIINMIELEKKQTLEYHIHTYNILRKIQLRNIYYEHSPRSLEANISKHVDMIWIIKIFLIGSSWKNLLKMDKLKKMGWL